MPALLQTEPPPSPAPGAAKEASGAAPKTTGALAPGRDRFIPVSRYGLRAKLIARLKEQGGDERIWGRALDCLAACATRTIASACSTSSKTISPSVPTATW